MAGGAMLLLALGAGRFRAPETRVAEMAGGASGGVAPAQDVLSAVEIELLAMRDPARALQRATAAADGRAREELRHAALCGWARVAPEAAADWVLAAPVDQRLAAAASVVIGAVEQPEAAMRVARRLCAADPTFVREHGHTVIAALGAAGEFAAAQQFAELGGPERALWMCSVFARWAQADPAAALKAAQALEDGDALAGAGAGPPAGI